MAERAAIYAARSQAARAKASEAEKAEQVARMRAWIKKSGELMERPDLRVLTTLGDRADLGCPELR